DARHDRRQVLWRERRRVGQAAGERDHLGALGHGHHVSHRRGLHDLGARGEQARVALELVSGGTLAAGSHWARFGASRWVPVVYRHASVKVAEPMKLILDILQGAGLSAATG